MLSWLGKCHRTRGQSSPLARLVLCFWEPSFFSGACVITRARWLIEQEGCILHSALLQTHHVASEKPFLRVGLCTQLRARILPVGYNSDSSLGSLPLEPWCVQSCWNSPSKTDLCITPAHLKHCHGSPIPQKMKAMLISPGFKVLSGLALTSLSASSLVHLFSMLCAADPSTTFSPPLSSL